MNECIKIKKNSKALRNLHNLKKLDMLALSYKFIDLNRYN